MLKLCWFSLQKHPEKFGEIFHALDVWQKSIKLSKKLAKVYNHIFVSYFVLFGYPFILIHQTKCVNICEQIS